MEVVSVDLENEDKKEKFIFWEFWSSFIHFVGLHRLRSKWRRRRCRVCRIDLNHFLMKTLYIWFFFVDINFLRISMDNWLYVWVYLNAATNAIYFYCSKWHSLLKKQWALLNGIVVNGIIWLIESNWTRFTSPKSLFYT